MHLISIFARFGILGLFLSGYVKGKLMGYRAETLSETPSETLSETPSEILVCIRIHVRIHNRVILVEIPRETSNTVFLEWMDG
jgi:hypothetical protein